MYIYLYGSSTIYLRPYFMIEKHAKWRKNKSEKNANANFVSEFIN